MIWKCVCKLFDENLRELECMHGVCENVKVNYVYHATKFLALGNTKFFHDYKSVT